VDIRWASTSDGIWDIGMDSPGLVVDVERLTKKRCFLCMRVACVLRASRAIRLDRVRDGKRSGLSCWKISSALSDADEQESKVERDKD